MKKQMQAMLVALSLTAVSAFAQVAVNVSGAQRAAQPIAVLPVQSDPSGEMDYIISSDLYKTGLFQPIDPNRINNRPNSPAEVDYTEFSGLGADYIVLGRVLGENGGSAQFVLNQVSDKSVVFNEQLSAPDSRAMAHQVADLILQRLTGKRGAFATRLAYVLEQQGSNGRQYSLIVSDIDGANRQELYTSSSPILSPAWSADGRFLAYTTYANYNSQIVVQNVSSGSRQVIVQSQSTSGSPAWAPDGSQLAISRADDSGNMDIYLVSASGGNMQRLTTHAGIDTEPVFSSDGRYIYFTSDRAGSPQIYRMNRQGGGVTRAVVGGNYSTNGDLSPDGQSMLLTRQTGGTYQIGLYDLPSGRFTALTNGQLDEGASFAPNGQLAMYTAIENGRTVLKMINLKGGVTQVLSDPTGRLRDPAWGPDTRR